jgi:hypothetical protein
MMGFAISEPMVKANPVKRKVFNPFSKTIPEATWVTMYREYASIIKWRKIRFIF